jgi:hypothetical protein
MASGRHRQRQAENLPLVIHERERLAKLVFLDQLIDEGDGVNDFGHI